MSSDDVTRRTGRFADAATVLDETMSASDRATVRTDPGATTELTAPSTNTTERYQIGDVLGTGGMGEVRRYHDAWIGRDIAIKRLHQGPNAEPLTQLRFLREARVQGQIEHPSVVPVYDLGVGPDGGLFFTMRRVRGETLADILDSLDEGDEVTRQKYSRRKLLTAFVNVCLAVHYAHTRGVVHRDLKPSNIMLGDFGEVYVLDWGIAKIKGNVEQSEGGVVITDGSRTMAGSVVGTPAYMSPEQVRGDVDAIDARTDVYALGLILFEILTLKQVHGNTAPAAIFERTLNGLDLRSGVDASDVPPELTDLCIRACAKERDARVASAREMADAVERFLDGDRDLERRRQLAEDHAERASKLTDLALSASVTPAQSQDARVDAMRAVMQALALDAQHGLARKVLVRLLVEHGAHMPPEVIEQQERSILEGQRHGLRMGLWVHMSWLSCIPVVYLMGIRSWTAVMGTIVATLIAIAMTRFVKADRRIPRWHGWLLAVAHFGTLCSITHWMGPFVFVPGAIAIGTVVFSLQSERRDRPVYIAIGLIACVVPYAIEWLHILPHAYEFHRDRVTIFARSTDLGEMKTVLGLLYLSLMYTVVPSWYFGRIRDSLAAAETERFLRAWHINRLAADAALESAPTRRTPSVRPGAA